MAFSRKRRDRRAGRSAMVEGRFFKSFLSSRWFAEDKATYSVTNNTTRAETKLVQPSKWLSIMIYVYPWAHMNAMLQVKSTRCVAGVMDSPTPPIPAVIDYRLEIQPGPCRDLSSPFALLYILATICADSPATPDTASSNAELYSTRQRTNTSNGAMMRFYHDPPVTGLDDGRWWVYELSALKQFNLFQSIIEEPK